ncbi:hypothetical protein WJX81_004750 [Elliptochloris bilobata]|uniref:Tryptophan--tRNA ligase, cytoplasmic n=1 Tax=Elliptochloris bilobata TaxID=381761 RepID=A0AAW1RZY4_9CHLO
MDGEASTSAPANATEQPDANDQVITPWDVKGGADGRIDYDKLRRDFGCAEVDDELVRRIERLTGVPAHPFLKRKVFYAHRDLSPLLDAYEKGEPFYLYTGRGPSSENLHLGHLIPFQFTAWLQRAFRVPLVIQITDDEKALWRSLKLEEARRLARENIKDIIACGFDPEMTFIFSDIDHMGAGGSEGSAFYCNCLRIMSMVNCNHVRSIFGLTASDNIGKIMFPAIQAAPAFSDSFPHMFGAKKGIRCLVPCAIDQDPYFRMTRDVAQRMGHKKVSLLESRFFPALQGENGKMSASDPTSAIFVTDTAAQIKNKINRYAFSGGGETVEEHRAIGANLDVDVPWKYLNFFMEDDMRLREIGREYGAGRMLTGEVKKELIGVLQKMVAAQQARRAKVDDAEVARFTTVRPMPDLFAGARARAAELAAMSSVLFYSHQPPTNGIPWF